MATKTIFDLQLFTRGSRRMDEEKAKINLALQFFSSYFHQICDETDTPRDLLTSVVCCHSEEIHSFCLEYDVRYVGEQKCFYIVAYFEGTSPVTTLLTTSSRNVPLKANAEYLPTEQVGPCYSLFDEFMYELFEKFPPHEDLKKNLQIFYDAARRNS